jgi:hypothetical protein
MRRAEKEWKDKKSRVQLRSRLPESPFASFLYVVIILASFNVSSFLSVFFLCELNEVK